MKSSKFLFVGLIVLVAVLGLACGGGEDAGSVDSEAQAEIENLVAIQKEIAADAGRALEILEENGMTLEQWEDKMAEIAADPELNQMFNEKLGQ